MTRSTPQPPCPACGEPFDAAAPANLCAKCGATLRRSASRERAGSEQLVGRTIAERYRLLDLLGVGGMGAVYKAEHVRMGKALAVKILRGDFARDPAAVARFRAEAQMVSRLSHPHTIAVFDFGEVGTVDGALYLAMEYVPGKDLATVLRQQGPLPQVRAAAVAEQLLESLAEAHDADIVHRDVKPSNVISMQTRSGEDFVKVLDFGIAQWRGASVPRPSDPFGVAVVGTPYYLSPEQARGEALDARSDLYSVGALLYELIAGRCPFVAPDASAIISAHLSQEPPPLAAHAPTVSPKLAAIVHRALQKRPQQRFQSADEMREALLALREPTASRPAQARPWTPDITSELCIASREDFEELERHVRALKRGRVAAPLTAAALLVAVGLAAWRWGDVYALLRERTPAIAAALPAALRPSDLFDGEEHEPNDSPAQANPLPLPPGRDGRRAGGVAVIRGHIGAKLSDGTGDVDVYRIEVPQLDRPVALHADWSRRAAAEGIGGLDVALTLNRDGGGEGSRRAAPLVAAVDHGGPGRPEHLEAAVGPGTYYLAVREKHPDDTGPVEKPNDWYVLRVWLAEPPAGEEIEPNDAPEPVSARVLRYPEWRALAERNALGEASLAHGTTSPEDPDTYAVVPRGPDDRPELVAAIPGPTLALAAQLWIPDDVDLGPPQPQDRVRFQRAGEGEPGEILLMRLPSAPRPGAAAIVQLRGVAGAGRYEIVALGSGAASGSFVLGLVSRLDNEGRSPQALALAAAFATAFPGSSGRAEVLLAAGKLAERLAAGLEPRGVGAYSRASALLGVPVFETASGRVRYAGAFESLIGGVGALAEEAAARLISRGRSCAPGDVESRARRFLERFPASRFQASARLWLARSEEDLYWDGGGSQALQRALAAYRLIAHERGKVGDEARDRLRRLAEKQPVPPESPRSVCP